MAIGPGTTLGAYEVGEPIGQGALGRVFRAYHSGLDRVAAVKVLSVLAPDPDALARFRREAQAIARMRHPNIVNVYDFGELEGTPYMIVEYVAGGSLNDRLKSGVRYSPAEALALLDGVGAGLDYAHGLQVVHRDVKPANVLLGHDGSPILADFGLAKLLQQSSVKTVSGVTTGTPAYMSPEQVMGAAVGPAADTYALTTMAYELLAGAIPFEGEGVLELLYAHVHREPPPASSRNPALGPEVDAALKKGLAKNPGQRWESSAALVGALREALRHPGGVPAAVPMAVEATMVMPGAGAAAPAVAAGAAPASPAAPGPAVFPRPKRRRRWPRRLAGVLVLLLLVAVALGILNRLRAASGPHLALTPAAVRRGGSVHLAATGFAAGRAFVAIGQPGSGSSATVVASNVDTGSGGWSTDFTVPATLAPGRYEVRACNGPAPGTGCAVGSLTVAR